jgi:hypothetical protein
MTLIELYRVTMTTRCRAHLVLAERTKIMRGSLHGGGLEIMLNPQERSLADVDAGPSPAIGGESAPRFLGDTTHHTDVVQDRLLCEVLPALGRDSEGKADLWWWG